MTPAILRSLRRLRGRAAALAAFAALVAVLVPACGHKPAATGLATPEAPCSDPRLEITIRASDRVNMNDKGQSLATVVRVYQLKRLKALEAAEFEALWQKDKETLGEDFVAVEELTLDPGAKTVLTSPRGQAAFVAVVALFRQPQGIDWRKARRLPPTCAEDPKAGPRTDPYPIRFLLEESRVELARRTGPGSTESSTIGSELARSIPTTSSFTEGGS